MESHSGQKWSRLFLRSKIFRITIPEVIPSSEMQIHPLKIDIDLSRFVFVGREFFWPVEKFFHWSRFFLPVEKFFSPVENFLPVENLFGRSRIFFTGREIFLSVEHFFTGREIFLSVEIFFTDGEFFFGRSRIPFSVENFFASRELILFCLSANFSCRKTSLVSGLYESNFVTWLNKENGGHFGCPGLYGTLATKVNMK